MLDAINLSVIPQTAETQPLFEAAALIGDPNVLTLEDAMGQAILENVRPFFAGPCHTDWLLSRGHRGVEEDRATIRADLKSKGLEVVIENHTVPFKREALRKSAERFMEDATALVARLLMEDAATKKRDVNPSAPGGCVR